MSKRCRTLFCVVQWKGLLPHRMTRRRLLQSWAHLAVFQGSGSVYVTDAMRLIGHLADEHTARRFGDFLLVQGIQNQLDHEKEGGWAVWVIDEDKLTEASTLLEEYRKQPDD